MDVPKSTAQIAEILSYYVMYYLSCYGSAAPDKLRKLTTFHDWQNAAQREIVRRATPALLEILDDQSLHAIARGKSIWNRSHKHYRKNSLQEFKPSVLSKKIKPKGPSSTFLKEFRKQKNHIPLLSSAGFCTSLTTFWKGGVG